MLLKPFSFVSFAGRPALRPAGAHRPFEGGVTLMEMLVASVVMLFVMAGLATILVSTTQIQAYQNELAEAQQNMRIVLSMTGDRVAATGTGLVPRSLALQTAEELWITTGGYVKTKAEEEGLAKGDLLFGVYYQRDFPNVAGGAGAPMLEPLDTTDYNSEFGWKVDPGDSTKAFVYVKARAGFDDDADTGDLFKDAAHPGLPLLIYNVKRADAIIAKGGASVPIIHELHSKASLFTRLSGVTENVDSKTPPEPSKLFSRIQILHNPTPLGWSPGTAATGDTPILTYVGIAHAVFAYKQETLPDGTPGGKFYMAEFTPGINSGDVTSVQGQFDLYAENIYDLTAMAVFTSPATGVTDRAEMFPTLRDPLGNTGDAALQWHFNNRPNLREVEISVTVRTGEPVPAGKMKGLYVPVTKAGYETSFVYRVVRGSTRSHLQAFHIRFSQAAEAEKAL